MGERIVIAVDSFKGSATSLQAADYIEEGLLRVLPELDVHKFAIADGGEGTVTALVHALGGRLIERQVTGPEGQPIPAVFALLDRHTAVIEMAEASGLTKITHSTGNPFTATTYGTGELILAALDEQVSKIYVGLGGSATNDGGVGMAQALGVSFKDDDDCEVPFGAEGVEQIRTIDLTQLDPRLASTSIIGLTDVETLLCGPDGAAYTFALQKGAKKSELERLDQGLKRLRETIKASCGIEVKELKGGGAAGGLGAGLVAFCGAQLTPGIETILGMMNIEEAIRTADYVITGEGKLDQQSLAGKAPTGIVRAAKKWEKPVIAIVGSVGGELQDIYPLGIDLVIDAIRTPQTLQQAMANVQQNLSDAGESAGRVLALIRKLTSASGEGPET